MWSVWCGQDLGVWCSLGKCWPSICYYLKCFYSGSNKSVSNFLWVKEEICCQKSSDIFFPSKQSRYPLHRSPVSRQISKCMWLIRAHPYSRQGDNVLNTSLGARAKGYCASRASSEVSAMGPSSPIEFLASLGRCPSHLLPVQHASVSQISISNLASPLRQVHVNSLPLGLLSQHPILPG